MEMTHFDELCVVLCATTQELSASSTEMAEQTSTLQAQHAELTRQHGVAQVRVCAVWLTLFVVLWS